jgi:formiminotetrahydrofolate cyclodeaminase
MDEGAGRFADLTLDGFLERLASSAPTPGGGSASAIAGALAASLTAMVSHLSQDRPRYAPYGATLARALEAAEASRRRFLALADEDAAAYAAYGEARRLPHTTPDEEAAREAATKAAARLAADVPLRMVRECHVLIEHVESLSGRSNLNASSDLDVAALLAQAAARGAGANVLVNVTAFANERGTGRIVGEMEEHLHAIEAAAALVHTVVRSGSLRPPEP